MPLTKVSAEKPKYKYILEFPNKFRVYTNDEQFLLNTLEKYGKLGLTSAQQDNARAKKMKNEEALIQSFRGRQCPECRSTRLVRDNESAEIVCTDCGLVIDAGKRIRTLDATHPGKPRYEIHEDQKKYRIISSRSKNQANCATVNKDTVEKVYGYLKKKGTKRSASDIETALHISPTTIHNALKVLRTQGRADFEIFGTKRKFLYKAL